QTPTSERFVGRASFAAISGAPVLTSEFEADPARGAYPGEPVPERAPISHLALVERADVYLIAPASANTLAKLAAGAADNLVTTAALAAACPVLVAPAMNNRMYANPATAANLRTLAARGITVIPPTEGELASHGEVGVGRLPEPAALLAAVERSALRAAPATGGAVPGGGGTGGVADRVADGDAALAGVRVLVTAGGTREPIDSVRYLGNRSSGRMGLALAVAAAARGAEVSLIAANVALPLPGGVRVVRVGTAAQLAAACAEEFAACDVLLMAAAVADFRPARPADHKLKKRGPEALTEIALEPTEDVLAELAAQRRPEQLLVGFAAEHGSGAVAYGREKLADKRLDAIVINDISRADIGFDAEQNEVVIVTRDGQLQHVARTGKRAVADAVLDQVGRLREAAARAAG
ncbi:MAG: bifunctional phosphopantothenoylcysteine decarboxylase/phosphopantothenate--cysteine ligase CoaBC, partial [Acidobacteriota bacterium]|nr:bifunctional phosphopantothenoylcysteine decarboxylase/phosphopantothenate--cysteine ligase CoaBC [Acidobacteriota bacterium]